MGFSEMSFLLALLFVLFAPVLSENCGPGPTCVTDLQGALGSAPEVGVAAPSPAPESIATLKADAFADKGLRPEVLALALKAFEEAWRRGDTSKMMLSVIDYSLPSNQRRLWVIDLETNRLLFQEYVAHGKGSGVLESKHFSNVSQSHKSNLGLMKTAETYKGKHGYSLKLDGLERGFNDNARSRAIVMHAASYATESFVKRVGRLGRSHGCPSLDPKVSERLIDAIKGGSLLFGYFPDRDWLKKSKYLN